VQLEDETVWLTQDQMAMLFRKEKSTVNDHIKNIYAEGVRETIINLNIRKGRVRSLFPIPKKTSLSGHFEIFTGRLVGNGGKIYEISSCNP
jgi:hypothetical protein